MEIRQDFKLTERARWQSVRQAISKCKAGFLHMQEMGMNMHTDVFFLLFSRNSNLQRMMLLGALLLTLIMRAAGQVPATPATPAPEKESDFSLSLYFTGDMRGNLEPCG